jgi:hypothetical protein
MNTYSRDKQDLFVLTIFGEHHIGNFIDIGCYLPVEGNNTFLLENFGWHGVSIDIRDFRNEWKMRKTPFIIKDALICDYKEIFNGYGLPRIIDYLSLDVDGSGDRFTALKKVFESTHEFKIITLEHDAYAGNELTERKKQREFLLEKNYVLFASNVMCSSGPFEDWWINPKYVGGFENQLIEGKYPQEIIANISKNNLILL